MKLNIKKVRDFINPLLSKKSIDSYKFDLFKRHLNTLKLLNQGESEEHQKNAVRDFLVNSFGYAVNTKGRIDLAIFKNHTVEVIIEAKSLTNKTEMITKDELNRKAFAEAIKYFMDERKSGNHNVRHIIILTAFEWFVFDAKDFERLFWQDKDFKKIYKDYTNPDSLLSKTGDVYNEFSVLIPKKKSTTNLFEDLEIDCAYFSLKENHSEKNLIAIYKLLSSDCLLKEFNPNDANSLNREFYTELLYILGLEEVKEGGKKLIGRAKNPQSGSLYENILEKLTQYEKPNDFESIIKLMIIWINRILFLKLLESQIVKWNNNQEYRFLNTDKIDDYDQLEMLFFEILAKKQSDRKHREFDHIPYLNSSLFEPHEMEESGMRISNLYNADMNYSPKTVIKDEHRAKKTGEVKTLHYLFEFLDAYDFSSDGTEEIGTDNKALINASVLGLIFEKLNGYKDGSFYTPSFITMYMARESITKAVIAKFNEYKGWNCQNLIELHNKIDDIKEANILIDSLKICDPAVGSGHFLVSALNEILFIKSELGVLIDEEGKRIRDCRITVENDELIVKDSEGEIFEYKRDNHEKSRIQKTLFKEKQNIIENCLFGVDINPNSVNICRLRLWVELLKNAYYKKDGALDTLPNIDINIKCGNSLISRFGLTDELKIKNIAKEIENYKQRVSDYKENLGTKKEVMRSIEELKGKFSLTLKAESKIQIALNAKLRDYVADYRYEGLSDNLILIAIKNNYGQKQTLFDEKSDEKKRLKLRSEIKKFESDIDEIEKGKIYENAFEWRFEFPEVLDEEGNFVGFDIVIGNPPYMRPREIDNITRNVYSQYDVFENQFDLYHLFIEKAHRISKTGNVILITPNTFLGNENNKKLRKFILDNLHIEKIIDSRDKIFEDADVEVLIIQLGATKNNYYEMTKKEIIYKHMFDSSSFYQNKNYNFAITLNTTSQLIVNKINRNTHFVSEFFDVSTGVKEYQVGKGKPAQTENDKENRIFHANSKLDDTFRKELRGKNIHRYSVSWNDEYIQYGECLAEPRNIKYFTGDRILVRQIPSKTNLIVSYTSEDYIIDQSIYIAKPLNNVNSKFVLGCLNSRLTFWYFINLYNEFDALFPKIKTNEFKNLPIPVCSETQQKTIEIIVDQILVLKKADPKADTTALEKQIDEMVYKLYNLTDEEIAIIEGHG